ncbi:MAG: glucose-1-phosphate adenylyltransferase [Candidatus Omnitrophica bacterium]|nr:glucose-1-phosphate adenylyltransferase [Candidatus Omnitrophota bacterium]
MNIPESNILALVLAGGKGTRLDPLTAERTKPSVPFGGKYRIIDFALSNFVNSGIYSIYLLVQYKSQSLIEHIRTAWSVAGMPSKHFLTVVPPQMRMEDVKEWYRGTADSVYQNINLIYDFKPTIVAVFSGDHVYRMDIRQMIESHYARRADLTIATVPLTKGEERHFGVLETDRKAQVISFKEKPEKLGEGNFYVSMGNYIFNTDVLVQALEENAHKETSHDFGKDVIPALLKRGANIYAYDCSCNLIPGLKPYEERFYWKDVGTIESYWKAHMDLLTGEPRLDLNNRDWPIYGVRLHCPPALIDNSNITNSMICEGSKIVSSTVKNSILGRSVTIEPGCHIEDSIILDFTHIGAASKITRTIVDRFNTIEKGTHIGGTAGCGPYHQDPSGIVVVRRGSRKSYYF